MKSLAWIDHAEMGRVPVPNSPMRYEGAEPLPIAPSRRLGLREVEVEKLRADRII